MSKITIDREIIEHVIETIGCTIDTDSPHFEDQINDLAALREAMAQPMTLNGHELFQDSEGTIPVTAAGQQVGFVAHQLIPPSDAGVFLDAPLAQMPTPDMFWNSDDADEPHDSIGCFLNDQICQHDLEVGAVFTIWRAKKLPSVTIPVTAIDEEECEAEYEVIEQAHVITKGTT